MTAARHRVLLVGPWRGGSAGSCCGGDPAGLHDHEPSAHGTAGSQEAGSEAVAAADVVRALRRALGDTVDVELVDPRNTVFVLPAVYRDARRSGLSHGRSLGEAVRATTPWALVVDGRVVSRSAELTSEAAVALVEHG